MNTSPVCFRVPPDERLLLEAVASFQGQSLSGFVRKCVVAVARGIIAQEGSDSVIRNFRHSKAQQADRAAERAAALEQLLDETASKAHTKTNASE
jgi:uncharacterized protein (DUF1778 family)